MTKLRDIAYNCGVYAIYNVYTDEYYIGSSNNIRNRWAVHRYGLRTKQHHSTKLNLAYSKYGEKAFRFLLIKECDEESLTKEEQYWIDYYDSYKNGYNMSPSADGLRGYIHKDTTIQKMKASAKRVSNTPDQKDIRSKRCTEQHRSGNLNLKKDRHPMAKVTVDLALSILKFIEEGIPREEIKRVTGLSGMTIQRIYMRKHWTVFDPYWKDNNYVSPLKGKPGRNFGNKASEDSKNKMRRAWDVQKRIFQAYWTAMRHVRYWGA